MKVYGMQNESVTVIIPAFNEADSIGEVVAEIRALHPSYEILVIDDGSSDETAAAATGAGADVYCHPYNIGNGAAVKTGIRAATGDILVFMDGDGQHDPKDIAKLVTEIPRFDLVVGARSLKGQASLGRAFGNFIYNRLASYVAKFKIADLTSGFRAVKSEIAKSFVHLLPNTYSYPTTLTLGVLRSGWSVCYLPVKVKLRSKGQSNIKFVQDGVRFFMIIMRICTLYSPFRIFLPISLLIFCNGLILYIFTFFTKGRFTNMSALLFSTSMIVFLIGLVSEQISQMRFERRRAVRTIKYPGARKSSR